MNKPNLRKEQPHLWRNIVALAASLVLISLPFMANHVTASNVINILQYIMPIRCMGYMFFLLGLALYVSTFFSYKNYMASRITLAFILGYNITWFIAIIISAIGNVSGFTVVSLWAYYTFTIYTISKDPGFAISALIRDVRSIHQDD